MVGCPRRFAVLLLDADGVVQRSPSFGKRITNALGFVPHDLEGLVEELYACEAPALEGRLTFPDAFADVFRRRSLPLDANAFRRSWNVVWPDASVLSIVQELRRSGLYCAVASNQEAHRAAAMAAAGYDDAFDAQFYSCAIGAAKPAVSFFELVLSRLGVAGLEVLFIDDILGNVIAAQRAGLTAVQYELPPSCDGGQSLRAVLTGAGVDGLNGDRTSANHP